MSYRPNRRNRITEQFAPRPIAMLESPGFRVLSRAAHQVLARIEIESANHGGKENGRLPVTYDDFEKYGIHRHAICAAIHELVAFGMVAITEPGRAGNAEFRKPTLFRLTYRHAKDEGGDGTHEWRKLADITPKESRQIARRARKTAEQAEKKPARAARKTAEQAKEKAARRAGKGKATLIARARKKQKSSGGKCRASVVKTATENHHFPVAETATTPIVRKPPRLSISRGGSRSAPVGSAVASEPPRAILPRQAKDALREPMLGELMRSRGCSRAEAAEILDSLPDAPPRSGECGEDGKSDVAMS